MNAIRMEEKKISVKTQTKEKLGWERKKTQWTKNINFNWIQLLIIDM